MHWTHRPRGLLVEHPTDRATDDRVVHHLVVGRNDVAARDHGCTDDPIHRGPADDSAANSAPGDCTTDLRNANVQRAARPLRRTAVRPR